LAADESHARALAIYCQLSTELEQRLPGLQSVDKPTTLAPVIRATFARRWAMAGLAAAAGVALWISLAPAPRSDGIERVASAIAEYETVLLSDGTQVELNAHTNLVFQATATTRRVRLGSGQAFFSVAKDPDRPFIVETPLGAVRVTGTAFDVRSLHAGNLAVTVAEGSVEIRLGENDRRSATAPIRLQSRDQLTLQDGQPQLRKLSESQLNRELAWREGQLALDNAPLHDVLDRFAHFHGTGISASPEVADLALSGQFTLTELDDFLLILETVHPVRVLRDQSGTIRVVSRD
jgi:transmembrane sensor